MKSTNSLCCVRESEYNLPPE